jgi:hypothetical protein
MGHPHFMKKVEKLYAHLTDNARKVATPETPNTNIVRPTSNSRKESDIEKSLSICSMTFKTFK